MASISIETSATKLFIGIILDFPNSILLTKELQPLMMLIHTLPMQVTDLLLDVSQDFQTEYCCINTARADSLDPDVPVFLIIRDFQSYIPE